MLKVAIIMGSTSDYDVMSGAEQILTDFGIEFEKRVISAHRTPELMFEYTKGLKGRGFGVVIAGAGGASRTYDLTGYRGSDGDEKPRRSGLTPVNGTDADRHSGGYRGHRGSQERSNPCGRDSRPPRHCDLG